MVIIIIITINTIHFIVMKTEEEKQLNLLKETLVVKNQRKMVVKDKKKMEVKDKRNMILLNQKRNLEKKK